MLKDEARWISDFIKTCDTASLFPMLNIGSSTENFRRNKQPWIDDLIFAPLRDKNFKVFHLDIKRDVGVDIVGDINDNTVYEELIKINFKSLLCCNVLEHILQRDNFCKRMEALIKNGSYIILTCPYKYPYHPDPIDTCYRPSPEQLAYQFRYCVPVSSEILDCGTYFDRLIEEPLLIFKIFLRLIFGFPKPKQWFELMRFQLWMFRRFRVSCIVLKKNVPT
jgi:hypothetical protein